MTARKNVAAFILVILGAVAALAVAGCAQEQQCPPAPPPTECPPCQCPQATAAPPAYTGPTREEWMDLNVRILFPSGGAILDAEARRLLDEAVLTMQGRTDVVRVRVEGHTDGRGADGSNEHLSQERATAVVEYLVNRGVPRPMLEAVGMGSSQPLTSDTSAMDREQNRRVEFSILVRRPVGAQ